MNGVGEPCAGEPHARFDRGPLARRPLLNQRHEGRESESPAPGVSTETKPAAYLTRQPAVTGGGRLLISEAAERFIAGLVAIPC
jgi:hypothetical protein